MANPYNPLIRGVSNVLAASFRHFPGVDNCFGIDCRGLMLACAGLFGSSSLYAATCSAPDLTSALAPYGNGEAVSLVWTASGDARQFRVWAQWRVPEGEAVQTHEVIVATKAARLPPSPARWRPLKLSIELQSICDGGAVSGISQARQLQLDARAEAACPPVDLLRFDETQQRLSWQGDSSDRVTLSFHTIENGKSQAVNQAVTGTAMSWPPSVQRPAVIRASRACGEVQRSRETFQLVP